MERLTYIDSLKGIGIILVVVGHLFSPYTDYLDDPINQMIYSFHMPLFFFLSGFVYGHLRKRPIGISLIKKTITLLVPYFGFSAFYCFIKNYSWFSLLTEDETHSGYWFTLTLFFIFLFGRITEIVVSNKNRNLELLFQVVISISLLVIAKFGIVPDAVATVLSFDKFAKFYLFFQIGKFVSQDERCKYLFTNNIVFSVLLCIYMYIFWKYGYSLDSVNIFSFILSMCGVCILFNIVHNHDKLISTKGVLPFLGRKSLDIYLVHLLFLNTLNKDFIRGFDVVCLQIIILFILSACVIFVSLGVSYIISNSELLSFLLFGRGKYANYLISKLSTNDKNA